MRALFELIFEDYWFDPSIIDLVLWFPHLSWGQFLAATLSVLTWSWVSERLWRWVMRALRKKLIALLFPNLRTRSIFGIGLGKLLHLIAP